MDRVRGSSVEGDELDPVRIGKKREIQRVHRTLNPNRVIERKRKGFEFDSDYPKEP